jgi:hypothetical protein
MRKLGFGLVIAGMLLLGGCAATDHSAAVALGNAGIAATQNLSDQTTSMSASVSQLAPLWGVHDVLICANVKVELRDVCLKGAVSKPDPALAKQLAVINDVLAKHKAALGTLNQAYAAFVDLAKYNAGQEASASLASSFKDVNAFLAAASALSPGGGAAPVIGSKFEEAAGGVVGLMADSRQNHQILLASKDLHAATDSMTAGLALERNAVADLLTNLQSERANLAKSILDAGLVSPTEVLTPVINQAFPNATVLAPSEANNALVMAAARNVVASQGQAAVASAAKSYDDALAALRALSAQHQRLEMEEKLDLAQVEAEIANLKADAAQMKPPSAPTGTSSASTTAPSK